MKAKLPSIIRILLGLLFIQAGLIGLLNLVPPPPDLPEGLMTFNAGLMASKYFFPFLKSTELICGILLVSGFFVPLALVILAPIVLNIFFVHAFLAPSGVPLSIIIGVMMIYLSFFAEPYRQTISLLFKRK